MNRLSDSASLYLRQHADNPVHWQPWDETALALARDEGRPILLSIGYSACHWCHVMAHESFEDPDTAEVMNQLFVNIKVDREERPDLDKVYQLSHQLLTGRGGGWPLTVFLEPSGLTPFFAGTYFPPANRHGMPAFREVLGRIRAWYDASPDEVRDLNSQVVTAIGAIQKPGAGGESGAELLEQAAIEALARADRKNGGFGGAPKFPQAPLLAALPALSRHDGNGELLDIFHDSLRKMASGGLRDQLDGGYFRYTVDGDWTIPHFEKMLYDNAQLLPLYAEAAQSTGDAWLAEAANGIATWLTESMALPDGGFASSMDADADGEEGGFHVWQCEQVQALLNEREFAAARSAFGLDAPPNFEGHAWHLTRRTAAGSGDALAAAIEKLKKARAERIPPATDTKQLAAWNALCVDGFARAGMALERADWLATASSCQVFITERLWLGDQLHAVYADGRARYGAFLDDHAFLLQASLSLLRADWHTGTLEFAITLADRLLEAFIDPANGGFFFTADGQEAPMARLRVMQDDATPSGNGIAARALVQLGHLTGDPRYLSAAEEMLNSSAGEMRKYPLGHASLLTALDEFLDPPAQVIISGSKRDEIGAWISMVRQFNRVHCYAPAPGAATWPAVIGKPPVDGETTAWVCEGMRCLPPVVTMAALEEQLKNTD